MKRISLILSLVLLISLLSACGTKDNSADDTDVANSTTLAQDVELEISKDTLADADEFLNNMESYGADVKDNADGNSYIFTFSVEEHKKLLDEKYAEVTKAFKDFEADENHYIDAVEYDEDFRNLVFNVNKDLYDSDKDATNNILIAAKALSYQMYLGTGQKTNVKVVYSGTEEVVSEFSLPMNLVGQ